MGEETARSNAEKRGAKNPGMNMNKTRSWLKHLDFILLDVFCLHMAFALAYMTRHGFSSPYANPIYYNLGLVYTLVDVLVLVMNQTMKNVLKRGRYKEFAQTIKHVTLVAAAVLLYMFAVQAGDEYSRITFFLQLVYYIAFSYSTRLVWKAFVKHGKKEIICSAVFFITTEDRAEQVIRKYQKNSINGSLIQGICVLDKDCRGQAFSGIPVVASRDSVLKYLQDKWVDEVFISLPEGYRDDLIASIADMGIVVHVAMEQLDVDQWKHQTIQKVAGTTVRTISMTRATPRQAVLKRTVDIVGGIVGCVLTGILTLIIGPMIYIKSPGPIFFTQTRVGKNGKKFKMYKFRSMYPDAEERKAELMAQNRVQGGLMFKLDYDPRIIGCERRPDGTVKKGIGNFIRDYSLDEFPQFFNVLKGDLSLCGTRPPTVDEWEQYELHHRARLAIKPGITGLWQISGRSNITDFEEVVELDKRYIREWSMGLDFRILLQTVKVVFKKEGSM